MFSLTFSVQLWGQKAYLTDDEMQRCRQQIIYLSICAGFILDGYISRHHTINYDILIEFENKFQPTHKTDIKRMLEIY